MILEQKRFWRIGEIMIQEGWISWNQLGETLAVQRENGRLTGEILIGNGIVSSQKLYQALAIQAGMKYVDLEKVRPEPEALQRVPKRFAYDHHILPLINRNQVFVIAVSSPLDDWPDKELREMTKIFDIRPVLAHPEALDRALFSYYGPEGVAA